MLLPQQEERAVLVTDAASVLQAYIDHLRRDLVANPECYALVDSDTWYLSNPGPQE